MEFRRKRDTCLVCGESIPYLRHVAITYFNGAECPKCHSYMKFSKVIYLSQIVLFLLIFPSLNLVKESSYLVGSICIVVLVASSFAINYFAKYEIDPAHTKRLHSGK